MQKSSENKKMCYFRDSKWWHRTAMWSRDVMSVSLVTKPITCSLLVSRFSWAEEQLGCLATLRLGRWWHRLKVYSAPRRCGRRAADGGGWSWSFCCLSPRFRPTREFQPSGIPAQRPDRQAPPRPPAPRSSLCVTVCGHDPLETEVQPWMNETWPWLGPFLRFSLCQT